MEMQLHAYTWYQLGHKEVSVVVVLHVVGGDT